MAGRYELGRDVYPLCATCKHLNDCKERRGFDLIVSMMKKDRNGPGLKPKVIDIRDIAAATKCLTIVIECSKYERID